MIDEMTTIKLTKGTVAELIKLGGKGDTYEDIIQRLLTSNTKNLGGGL